VAATGENADEAIRARAEAAIDARLPARVARQAKELFARYVGCRGAARALPQDGDLAARVQAVGALRGRRLRPGAGGRVERDAGQDGEDDGALARGQALAETEPGSAERAERLDEIEAAMPAPARAVEEATTAPLVTLAREQELRAAGAPPEQIRALREAAFGP